MIAAVLFGALSIRASTRSVHDAHAEAEGLESVDLGAHTLAVLEPHARIDYDVDVRAFMLMRERARVQQRAGRVLYRVDDGAALAVHTGAGDIELDGGGALVVDVDDVGASVGVFDGVASLRTHAGALALHAAEVSARSARAALDAPPRLLAPGRESDALLGSLSDARAASFGDLQQRLADAKALREQLRAGSLTRSRAEGGW
ncbi:MAG TPA: hypothetical protein VGO62_21825 [Myxococcota bacterium]